MSTEGAMPDYGYSGGGSNSPLSLYSMLYRTPTQPGYGGPPQQPLADPFHGAPPQRFTPPWWQQMFWNNPAKATDPEKKDDISGGNQKQAMQMGQLGLQMLQPRPPTHTGP